MGASVVSSVVSSLGLTSSLSAPTGAAGPSQRRVALSAGVALVLRERVCRRFERNGENASASRTTQQLEGCRVVKLTKCQ